MTELRPHLACDIDLDNIKWPVIVMPKLDGVRALNIMPGCAVTGRSKKPFKNAWVNERFSGEQFQGIDGELCLGDIQREALCRETTGFTNRKKPKPGKPVEDESLVWHAFDYLAPHVIDQPYIVRLAALETLVQAAEIPHLKLVEWEVVHDISTLLALEDKWLTLGMEGIIVRDPQGMHKSGRATSRAGAYLRLKRFIDFEGEVVTLIEAQENTNEAKTNELGRTERSTHKENMVPKGMIGMLQVKLLKDVEHNGAVILTKDTVVDVGPGNMKHEDRIKFWLDQSLIMGQAVTCKLFPKGQMDKPRFPTFKHIRSEEDMSE